MTKRRVAVATAFQTEADTSPAYSFRPPAQWHMPGFRTGDAPGHLTINRWDDLDSLDITAFTVNRRKGPTQLVLFNGAQDFFLVYASREAFAGQNNTQTELPAHRLTNMTRGFLKTKNQILASFLAGHFTSGQEQDLHRHPG